MSSDPEVVVVGAGIAGGALAAALGRNGIPVLLLEKSLVHQDRVRGEFLVPWGVDEARKLGVIDVLLAAGGHYTPFSIPYGEGILPEAARARPFDLGQLLPDVPGAMTFGHPHLCQALDEAAQAAGASLLRAVTDLAVSIGVPPRIAFTVDGRRHELTPRLVVGADGRGSTVARHMGARSETAPQHHLLAGLLVDGVEAWPAEEFCIGTERDLLFYVFPQGEGRVRLYLGYSLDQRGRFSGAGNERKFLEAFRLSSLPESEIFCAAQAAGPCRGYPNADTWIDSPAAPGIVLIGDAAGHNDPTIGQGLAIAFRDARLVLEALLGRRQWTDDIFASYVQERRERMRRLRFVGQQYSILRAEFTEEARARRRRAVERVTTNPRLGLPLLVSTKGPFAVPEEAMTQSAWDQLMN